MKILRIFQGKMPRGFQVKMPSRLLFKNVKDITR